MKLAAVNWLVYGEWGVPFWAAAFGGAVFLYVALRWLSVEKRNRKGILPKCLPWTLTVFLLLVTLFLWHPVAVRIASWEVPARVLVLADESASMDQPLAGRDSQSQLDALQFWQPSACEERPMEARRLQALLRALRSECDQCLESLDRFENEAEQGIPPDEALRLRQGALAERLRHGREEWLRDADGLGRNLDALQNVSGVSEWKTGVESFAKVLDSVLTDFEKQSAGDAAAAVRRLVASMATADPVLEASQKALDQSFLEKNAARLAPLMKEYGARTRSDATRQALKSIGSPEIMVEPYDGRREPTDLYALINRALDRHQNEQVSQVVLLSDGGHNGPAGAEVMARLKDEKIQFLAVGVGIPGTIRPDFAIIDWRLPLIARANRAAMLKAVIRTAAPTGTTFTVRLVADQVELASVPEVADGKPEATVNLSFKTPAAGRHALRLEVQAAEDSDPANNVAQFSLDTMDRAPEMLLVGTTPDWDTAYLRLASERVGVKLSGVFTEGKAPRRGSVGEAIPEEADHWFRNQAVILGGRTFQGFSDKDADVLYRLVTEKGGTLMILPESVDGYVQALATRFGWKPEAQRLVRPALRLPAEATRLPLLRLGVDGPQSERLFVELGPCESAVKVPAQDRILVEAASGEPVCSMGFYGRGKVVLWGLKGVSRMREFEHAQRVDRLMESLVAELAMPVFGSDGARLAAPFIVNPGLEQLYPEFNPAFLQGLAGEAGGTYRSLTDAGPALRDLAPGRSQIVKKSTTYRVGGHPALFLALVLAATLHWALRKLAGLVI